MAVEAREAKQGLWKVELTGKEWHVVLGILERDAVEKGLYAEVRRAVVVAERIRLQLTTAGWPRRGDVEADRVMLLVDNGELGW